MRLIDADALLDSIDKYANEPIKLNDRRWDTRCTAIILDMKGTVKQAPTVGGWISVKDRMPPNDSTKVLTYGNPVTHWMPLPEPPEEDA